LKQNVPGYYGIGTAIQSLVDEGKTDRLKQLFNEVPFFKALILNSMMALSKSYFELTAYIAEDRSLQRDFWNMLLDEYRLSKEMVLLISGYRDVDGRGTGVEKIDRDTGTHRFAVVGHPAIRATEN
jgi:phosphoenolpyruvate carboxylase